MDQRSADERDEATHAAVTDAVPLMVSSLARHGVTGVHWFLAFEGYPVVWLVTQTDAAKAVVAEHESLRADVLVALAKGGVAPDLVAQAVVTVESQETVDREWDGNWWYAMK